MLMVSCILSDVPTVIRNVAPNIFSVIERPDKELMLLVPTDQARSLICTGGATIDLIRKASGCQVRMFKDQLPYSDEHVFHIPGNIDQLDNMVQGVMEVMKLLKKHPLRHDIIHYNPFITCDEDFVTRDCGGYTKTKIVRSGSIPAPPPMDNRDSNCNRESNYNYSSSNQVQQDQQWNQFINSMQQMTGISINEYDSYPQDSSTRYNSADYQSGSNAMQMESNSGYQSAAPVNYDYKAQMPSPYRESNYVDQVIAKPADPKYDVYNVHYSSTPKADLSRDRDRHYQDRYYCSDDQDRRDREDRSHREYRDSRDYRDRGSRDYRDDHVRDQFRTRPRSRSRSPARIHMIEDDFLNEDITKDLAVDDALLLFTRT